MMCFSVTLNLSYVYNSNLGLQLCHHWLTTIDQDTSDQFLLRANFFVFVSTTSQKNNTFCCEDTSPAFQTSARFLLKPSQTETSASYICCCGSSIPLLSDLILARTCTAGFLDLTNLLKFHLVHSLVWSSEKQQELETLCPSQEASQISDQRKVEVP